MDASTTPLQFGLAAAEQLTSPIETCLVFDLQSAAIDLPCITVDDQQIWATLHLKQVTEPVTLQLNNFGIFD